MKRFLATSVFAIILALGIGYSAPASAKSPIFGNAKVATLSTDAAKQVTAKGGTTAYYLYIGATNSGYANYYAGLAQYYNYYGYNGSGSSSYTTTYAYNAYYYSNAATSAFYNAYYYSYYGY